MSDDLDPIIDPDPDPTPDPEDPAYLLLKASLGRKTVPEEIEALMRSKLSQARGGLKRAGLELKDSDPADCGLIAAYAEWLYTRRHVEDPKPRSLVDEIRSRQVDKSTGTPSVTP